MAGSSLIHFFWCSLCKRLVTNYQVERAYDDFQHLKGAMKDNFADSSATWKSMALFPTPESLGNFLLLALSYLGESILFYQPILNFLDNSPDKSFISQLKILKLTNKVRNLVNFRFDPNNNLSFHCIIGCFPRKEIFRVGKITRESSAKFQDISKQNRSIFEGSS